MGDVASQRWGRHRAKSTWRGVDPHAPLVARKHPCTNRPRGLFIALDFDHQALGHRISSLPNILWITR